MQLESHNKIKHSDTINKIKGDKLINLYYIQQILTVLIYQVGYNVVIAAALVAYAIR